MIEYFTQIINFFYSPLRETSETMKKQAKNRVGRPAGPPKRAINLYLPVETCDKLGQIAGLKGVNISELVEKSVKLLIKKHDQSQKQDLN